MDRKVSTKSAQNRFVNNRESVSNKMKIFTKIERRITTVNHADYIKKSDVTLGDRKKLAVLTSMNLIFYLG